MAPNSEDVLRIPSLCWGDDTFTKEKQRPPLYNPEDYAAGVRKWARKSGVSSNLYASVSMTELDCPRRSSSFRDYRNPMLVSVGSEMTLRQFGTVSELLSKLRADLRLSYPSFVQEFVSDPYDGVTLLLELLRAVQISQGSSGGGGGGGSANTASSNKSSSSSSIGGGSVALGRVPPLVQRKALLDELACLQCLLCCCARYSESVRRLSSSSTGLFTLAVCIMSNVNKARIIALQLLTRACGPAAGGHSAVSEAMSTLRLRFGEPVRFRFLVGMLVSAGGQGQLLACGLKFVNAFLDTSGSVQKRLYIQAELEQAGLDLNVIKKIVPINSSLAESVFQELDHWEKKHMNVEALLSRLENAERQNDYLKDKVLLLERKIQILQEEKGVLMSLEQCLKDRCGELQDQVLSLKSCASQDISALYCKKITRDTNNLTAVEDEGISSSERSSSPEALESKSKSDSGGASDEDDDDAETTIDDVIRELRNIVNDAESEALQTKDRKGEPVEPIKFCYGPVSDRENEIVPSNLHPQPPRKSRSLVHLYAPSEDYRTNGKVLFYENETSYTSDEGSDSLLSASRCHIPPPIDTRVTQQNRVGASRAVKNKSKSLDRLDDQQGGNVDIIEGLYSREKLAVGYKAQSDSGNATSLSRSTIFVSDTKDKRQQQQRQQQQHKIFLPCYDQREKEVHYYFPTAQDKCNLVTNFVINRGHTNDGLYSGYRYSESANDASVGAGPERHKQLVKSHSYLETTGKVTDFPSGLY